MPPMQPTAIRRRQRGAQHLPATAERAKGVVGLEDVNAAAVVRNANGVDAAQWVLHEIDLDFARVGIQRVPHKFFDGRQRRRACKRSDMVGTSLNVDVSCHKKVKG